MVDLKIIFTINYCGVAALIYHLHRLNCYIFHTAVTTFNSRSETYPDLRLNYSSASVYLNMLLEERGKIIAPRVTAS